MNPPPAASRRPFFSIIVSPHRDWPTLHDALRSIAEQDFHDHETLVVDGGDMAGLSGLIAKDVPESRAVTGPLDRPAAAINSAATAASGRYLVFLQPGDVWHSRYLRYQHAVFDVAPDTLFSRTGCCRRHVLGDEFVAGVRSAAEAPDPVLAMLLEAVPPTRSCLAVPRAPFLRCGGLDDRMGRFADFDLVLRLLGGFHKAGRLACEEHPAPHVPQILVLTEPTSERADLADGLHVWHRDLLVFLDRLFDYPFMRRFAAHRQWFEARLIEDRCALLQSFDGTGAMAA